MLEGNDAGVYKTFADQVSASKIFGTTEAKPKLLGSEVSNVLNGVVKVGTHFGAKLLEAIADSPIIPIPDGFNNAAFASTNNGLSGSRRISTFTYSIDQIVDGCTGAEASCKVRVEMDIALESGSGGPKGDPVNFSIEVPTMKLKVTKLVASNAYVSVVVAPGDSVLSAASLIGEVAMDSEKKILGAFVEMADFVASPLLTVSDKQSNDVVTAQLNGGFTALMLDLDMQSKDTSLAISDLVDMNLNATLTASNAAGDKVTGTATLDAGILGSGPFTYVFGSKLEKQGEDATNFLGADAVVAYSATVGGKTLFNGALKGGRAGNETLKLDDFSVQHSGRTYKITGEFSEDGGAIKSLDTTDPVSGVRIQISTNGAGVTSGTVTSGGTQLGTIAKNAEGKLLITYTDTSTQLL